MRRYFCHLHFIPTFAVLEKTRKDIDLRPDTIRELQKLADADKRKLKNYMEKVLEDHIELKTKKEKWEKQ